MEQEVVVYDTLVVVDSRAGNQELVRGRYQTLPCLDGEHFVAIEMAGSLWPVSLE